MRPTNTMVNIGVVLFLLCCSLLPLPSKCQGWKISELRMFPPITPSSVWIGCFSEHDLLAPGYITHSINKDIAGLRDFYTNCIGKRVCAVQLSLIRDILGGVSLLTIAQTERRSWAERILTCLPEDHYFDAQAYQIIEKNLNIGFLIGEFVDSGEDDVSIHIETNEGEEVALALYYVSLHPTSSFTDSDTGYDTPIIVSGGSCIHCTPIDDGIPKVLVYPEDGQVVVTMSNVAQFAIGFYRLNGNQPLGNLPSGWTFIKEDFEYLGNSCNRYYRNMETCSENADIPSYTTDPSTRQPMASEGGVSDSRTQAMTSEDEGVSDAVIGVSVVAGLLLAAILVIVVIFLLWKRNMLTLPVKSTTEREAAPTPTKQKEDISRDGTYSQPYDNVRTPDILNNRDGSNGNLYAEVKKDRKKPPLVSGSSLHIEENDLYSGSGDGAPQRGPVYTEVKKDRKKPPLVSGSSLHIEENDLYSGSGNGAPQRGPRESAGVYIVENEGYDSFGTK